MKAPNSADETTYANRPNRDKIQETHEKQISVIYAATNRILSNLSYIRDELPGLKATTETRGAILKMCGDFGSEIGDIRMEVRRLEDNLGMHPGEEPFRHGMESDEPKETMVFINEWLAAQIQVMLGLVTSLRVHPEHDADASLLSLLLEESATNIINDAIALREALDAIRASLALVQSQA
jgi:hypothetical protein